MSIVETQTEIEPRSEHQAWLDAQAENVKLDSPREMAEFAAHVLLSITEAEARINAQRDRLMEALRIRKNLFLARYGDAARAAVKAMVDSQQGRKKSVDLLTGRVGAAKRQRGGVVRWADQDAAIDWLERHGLGAAHHVMTMHHSILKNGLAEAVRDVLDAHAKANGGEELPHPFTFSEPAADEYYVANPAAGAGKSKVWLSLDQRDQGEDDDAE